PTACSQVTLGPPILRPLAPGRAADLAATAYVTVPSPVPLDPDVTVSHVGALLVAVHVQLPNAAVTPTVPVPAAEVGEALVASSVNGHGAPSSAPANLSPPPPTVPLPH